MICFILQCRFISGHLCIPFNARQILSAGDEYYFVKQGKELHCSIVQCTKYLSYMLSCRIFYFNLYDIFIYIFFIFAVNCLTCMKKILLLVKSNLLPSSMICPTPTSHIWPPSPPQPLVLGQKPFTYFLKMSHHFCMQFQF